MIPEYVHKNDVRKYSRLLGIKNPNQLEYKKLS
jgi:hypothetical protein